MYDEVRARYDRRPTAYLVDGGFGKKDDVTYVEQNQTAVYSPLYAEQKLLDQGKDPYAARPQRVPR